MLIIPNDERTIVLPYYDIVFKKTFTTSENFHLTEALLTDVADYDPLGLMALANLKIDSPYNYKDVNQLLTQSINETLYTEVDFACSSDDKELIIVEMQIQVQPNLEKRLVFNTGLRFAQSYANVGKGEDKYRQLKAVISITILYDNLYDDEHPIRYFRPHDQRIGAYKNDKNLGLEIVIELKKDASKLPTNLQHWFHYFRTGKAKQDAPSYIKEAAKMAQISSYTKTERTLLDKFDRAQQLKVLYENDLINQTTQKVTRQITKDVTRKVKEQTTKETTFAFAKKLLAKGMSQADILEITGLDEIMIQGLC